MLVGFYKKGLTAIIPIKIFLFIVEKGIFFDLHFANMQMIANLFFYTNITLLFFPIDNSFTFYKKSSWLNTFF